MDLHTIELTVNGDPQRCTVAPRRQADHVRVSTPGARERVGVAAQPAASAMFATEGSTAGNAPDASTAPAVERPPS